MRILYLDCGMGAAGDMLQGALVSLFSKEEQESFITKINNIGLRAEISLTDDVKCGITGKHISVRIDGEEEHSHDVHEHHHHHDPENSGEHEHEHNHSHYHASMADIREIISKLDVSDKVKKDVISVYEIVANAESKVHGRDVSEVHFHEVGMIDAIADITGVAMLIEKLGVDKIICSPINTGYGKVKCAHGILPVPAPATAEILNGVPVYAGRFEGEMCTPTGAALLKYYVDSFSNMPMMVTEQTGYGTGNKDFSAANVVRAVIGDSLEDRNYSTNEEEIIEINFNVDDMSSEELSYAVDKLIEAGANDAFVTPVIMKKGRNGSLVTVLCTEEKKNEISGLIFKHTSTIGIRECVMRRSILSRNTETVSTKDGDIRIKVSEGYGVTKAKPEYDDIKKIAEKTGKSISEIKNDLYKTGLL